jgi:hypothetical protein
MFPSHPYGALLGAVLDGFVVDWVCRQKFGTASLAIHVLKQLPVLTPAQLDLRPSWSDTTLSDWLRPYVVELTYTSHSVAAAARELGWAGPPFRWDSARRRILRAEIDAALFHAYGLSRIETQQVMDSFSAVKKREQQLVGEFRTGRLVLEAYDRMSKAGTSTPFRSALWPAPGDSALAHTSESLRSGESSHTVASNGPDRDG